MNITNVIVDVSALSIIVRGVTAVKAAGLVDIPKNGVTHVINEVFLPKYYGER